MSSNKRQSFNNRVVEKITIAVALLTDLFFEHDSRLSAWNEKKRELDYDYRDSINTNSAKKTGWFFMLFFLVPCLGLFDLSSIASFISYLATISGSHMVGAIISFFGWLFFMFLELGIGWLIIYSKTKPALRFFSYLLAGLVTIIPAYLIYTSYSLTPDKSPAMLFKTIALMLLSFIIHVLFFLLIVEIWAAINHNVYNAKNWVLHTKDPEEKMRLVKDELLKLYPDLDRYVVNGDVENVGSLLSNRAWYLWRKLRRGGIHNDYDLSDYDPNTSYAP